MSIINDLIVTSDKKHLISCSDDKTIRVWDMQTKKEVRKILGEIGKGSFGMVYAIALSPDDRFLAVGGFFSESRIENVDMVSIRIYNFPTGELLHILKSHKNIVSDLSFSSDGQYLVSSSLDYTVKIWDATDEFKLVHTFSEHTDDVYAVRIFRHQEDYRVVSAAHDHEVIFRSLNRKEMLASFSHDDRTGYLAVSRKYIASSGYDKKINIFDLNLTHIKTIESETIPTGLAFSPDGKLLLAGTGDNPLNCNIYDNEQSFKILHSFQKHENLTRAIAFADNTTAVTGGGDNLDIWFWNPRTGETKDHIAGGKNVWSVGIESDEIAFGNTFGYQDHNHRGLLEKGFSLSAFTPFQPKNFSEFNRIFTRFRKYTLSHTQGGPYGYNEGILLVKKGGEVISRIERDSTNGLGHNCYGFTPDGTILSGGSNGHLKAYNTDGDEIADFTGHTGEVWAIALDGNRLVSGGDDQVIHVWDLDKLKQGQTQVSPSFSLFVSNDNQWVVWTPEGFFNASEYGTKYIGFHINRGEENAAEYISADQLYDQYYRPDLVAKRIQGGHEDEIQAELSRIGNIDDILKSGLPPILEMVNAPAGKIRNRDLTLKLK
ncbi:MAG: WD40 repeat domain-containing protein, partial [Desulfobacteraceae bacterium]|nr:WD40 repeat domain-containing protein [Desulfobacteraceae bacterium]